MDSLTFTTAGVAHPERNRIRKKPGSILIGFKVPRLNKWNQIKIFTTQA
jgi:hypothetical protein